MTISSEAASRIATVSPIVTSPTGVFNMLWSRYRSSRLAWVTILKKKPPDQVESCIAIVTLIGGTASAITTHSDNAPIVTEVAVALASRDGTAGAERLSKPAVPGDHVMVQILACAGESPTLSVWRIRSRRRQYCGRDRAKNGKTAA
ncbi:hypothetical protein I6F35_34805 [Bradyrhizobium sp. BRP22]|uniref:hypothetical protein n=1 Tax=Bradyrhizobium sp. BRP22 TaxID=2793821 RepID=UPI001CD5308C|nr:hypothetical protein [Bradyrhizobium sp. BRP22]MCA1458290.1 hypothetical protein [Bradyrhizobium sp. BRP22]